MNFRNGLRLLWLCGGLAFVLAALRPAFLQPHPLCGPALRSGDRWHEGDFVPNAAYRETAAGLLPPQILTVGSWVVSDEWEGEARTPWIASPAKTVRVCVAGYPHRQGCSLRVEFRHADGHTSTRDCDIPDPRERWEAWDIHLPDGAAELRLVAADRADGWGGWLAFSEPFTVPSNFAVALYQSAQVLATLALTLVLVWLPGIFALPKIASPEWRAAVLSGLGPLLLVACGAIVWALGGLMRSVDTGPACLVLLWLVLGVPLWRAHQNFALSLATQRVLALSALCALAAVAKSTYSGGPEGEHSRGTVPRTLAVGNRNDTWASYAVVQIAGRHLAPAAPEAELYFSPWTFFSRGPLAGLAATPVVYATGGRPPASVQGEMWEPFDAAGFAAYRIVMIVLATTVLVAFFALLAAVVGEAGAVVGSGLLALSPFGMHDIMFTWPKFVATAWLIASFLFAHQRRCFLGGLALALGYLFHPLTLLWAPFVALWGAGRTRQDVRGFAGAAAIFGGGVLLLVGPWMLAGALAPHLPGSVVAGQGGFLRYFVLADWEPATVSSWLLTRWQNFSNTFIPFWMYAVNASLRDLNSIYGPAGPLVKFAFSWWNTLPLGLGLLVWSGCMVALCRAARRTPAAFALLFAGPALLLCAYWGTSPTGLMRECGHPIMVAVIGLAIVTTARIPGGEGALFRHRLTPWWQLPETLLMFWLTTLANPRPPIVYLHALDPLWFALNIAALAAVAWLLAAARGGPEREGPKKMTWGGQCGRETPGCARYDIQS